ncbi:MAG: hypothetical protein ACE5JR_12540 [Gemmatimonadota bacterium]
MASTIKVQIVTASVPESSRERYLGAWAEWSGSLFAMGIRSELLECEDEPGTFTELTWLELGEEGALADDRMVRINDELSAAAERRVGDQRLHARVE